MLVGLFFSEIGTRLLAYCVGSDPGASEAACQLRADGDWGEVDFDRAERLIPSDRLFTVVSRDHLDHPEVRRQLAHRPSGTVVLQPAN